MDNDPVVRAFPGGSDMGSRGRRVVPEAGVELRQQSYSGLQKTNSDAGHVRTGSSVPKFILTRDDKSFGNTALDGPPLAVLAID